MDVLTFARLFTRYNVMSCVAEHVAKLGVCRANVGIMSGLCRDLSRNGGMCRDYDGNTMGLSHKMQVYVAKQWALSRK